MTGSVFTLYPLQVALTDFSWDKGSSSNNALYLVIFLVVVLIIVIVIGIARRGTKFNFSMGGKVSKAFSGFALRRMVKNTGLNREQIKMLDFVFKANDVTDPQKSLSTPSLLDHHFRHAYHEIERTSDTDAEIRHKHAVLFSTRNILEHSAIGALSSTHEITEGTTLTISYGKEKYNVGVVSIEKEHLAAESPKTVLGSQIKIPKGTKLDVMFFAKNNKGFTFETRLIDYSNIRTHHVILLTHSDEVKLLSHRRYRRRQADIACFMNLVYVEGTKKKQRLIVDKRRMSGRIMDISVGGCSIKTSAPVQVGARFKIEFTQGGKIVAALGQVLRTNKTGISTIIHVKFLKVTQKSMNLINSYVYEYANE